MKRSTNLPWSELKVGLILVVALIVGTVAVISFSGIREYFRPTFPLTTRFAQVSGLKPGAVVMLSGVHVGNVTGLVLVPGEGRGVEVAMAVFTAHQDEIRADAIASLGSQGLLGDKYVELSPGTAEAPPVSPGSTIAGTAPTDISQVVDQAQDAADRLARLLDELTALAKTAREGQGTAGRLLSDPALYDEARGAAKAMTGTADEVTRTAEAYQDLGKRLNEMLESDGSLGRLARDAEPFERLNDALGRLDTVLERVEKGEGSVGKALNDPELTDELTGLIKDLRELVRDVQENPKKYVQFTLF
jgi:phospholipid/cholesterol/gamma-HCH transport system substrate-binding protein